MNDSKQPCEIIQPFCENDYYKIPWYCSEFTPPRTAAGAEKLGVKKSPKDFSFRDFDQVKL
ncbi:MAG TPA: hypothetical protein PKN81_13635, partial [Anaerolineales bacterium]|nr:hypothetical protein [Anaerolineales bacterium]